MGRTKRISTGKGQQQRLDELLKPRRSTRNRVKNDTDTKLLNEDKVPFGKDESVVLQKKDDKTSQKTAKKSMKESSGVGVVAKSVKGSKLSVENERELLKGFDLNPTYGPCRGVSRRERYNRAIRFNITPGPEEVIIQILDQHENDFTFQKCIWDQNELLKLHV